jgi:hypothetical protein
VARGAEAKNAVHSGSGPRSCPRIVQKRGFPYDVVAQFVDEQLRDLADMAPEFVPLTRSLYRRRVMDTITDLLEVARLLGLGEDETRELIAAATQKVRTVEAWELRTA